MSPKFLMIFTEEEMGEWVPKLVSVRLVVVTHKPRHFQSPRASGQQVVTWPCLSLWPGLVPHLDGAPLQRSYAIGWNSVLCPRHCKRCSPARAPGRRHRFVDFISAVFTVLLLTLFTR